MLVTRRDPFNGQVNTIEMNITREQMIRWNEGEVAQRVFTQLTADEREFIISGIPPGKWEEYMGCDEEDEEA